MGAAVASVRRAGGHGRALVRERPLMGAGLALLGLLVLLAALGPLLTPWGATEIDRGAALVSPLQDGHLLGTDRNGMDIFARLLYGARIDLAIAVASVSLAVVVGGAIGSVVGYVGGWVDELSMRAVDLFQSFPAFVLALTVAALLGPGALNLIVVLALINVPAYVRLMRTEVRSTREHGYVAAARAAGASRTSVLVRHVIPNSLRPLLVIAPLNCGWAILTVAGLSFIGLGIRVPEPEWGAMISAGADDMIAGQWWTSVAPGVALFLAVLGFNLTSEGLLESRRARPAGAR
jgi:peptide/nickel transport system permease protein